MSSERIVSVVSTAIVVDGYHNIVTALVDKLIVEDNLAPTIGHFPDIGGVHLRELTDVKTSTGERSVRHVGNIDINGATG